MSLKTIILQGVLWVSLSTGSLKIINVIIGIILARLLEPEDFGLVALALIIVNLFDMFRDLGIGIALIHNKNEEDIAADTAFYIFPVVGIIFYAISYIIAPPIAVFFKEEEFKVSELVQKINFSVTQTVTKIKKDKPVIKQYELGAIPINYTVKGIVHSLWLGVSRNKKHGGLAYLLVKSKLSTAIEVAKWAFRGCGLRWKIEEYHRHVKQEYRLEEIQIKTFDGLQSVLSVLTVAMYMIYKKISSLHFSLLLDAGYNYLNKHTVRELTNFIYYKW